MNERQYVIFKLAGDEFGVDIMHVKEISEHREASKVPNTPSFIEGIINYRGVVTPVINLSKKFNQNETEITNSTRIIIVYLKNKQTGFIVDDASQVLTISNKDVDDAPDLITSVEQKFISGIAKVDDRMIIILDLEKVLNEKEKKELLSI
ncbi:MAG: chemotaxis protein CheW [Alkaliphilus sp.]|nr:purine-binding chemotaxis protein CheW [bacterium AH-315-G05]PHS32600.1 MAG: chemotaxis protein CheW [Alkaliphilus sp.]